MADTSPKQEWLDKWLSSKNLDELHVLHERNKNLKDPQKLVKSALFDELKILHEKWMLTLPKRLRFMCPSKGMVGARARELKETREADPSIQRTEFGEPPKPRSILDL